MDDTQMSKASDAAATRKRRSSILKSQRAPRTPLSELEFNVATPTDTTKSRRVSFSRRTGVAEYATNEATTTWKNFYEEHNKSVESSGNDSGSKQVGHLGNRIFDQQFEEVEVDFIGIYNTGPNINVSSSLMNFEHQVAALECTDDLKVPAPQSNLELSAFTNTQTKLFDELAITSGEVTDRIDVNFSNVQTVGNDDLDDIQNDLKQNFQSALKRQNMSAYFEVDLNMTQAVQLNDDMSIIETVHSPKVQNVSKNGSKAEVFNVNFSQKPGDDDDLDEIQRDLHQKFGHDSNMSLKIDSKTKVVTDEKENIAVNPYAPLKETENFAVNEEADKVLVFDGKRLTLQAEKVEEKNPRLKPENTRKTIVLNLHDDLPNFVDDLNVQTSGLMDVRQLKKNMVLEDNMFITEPIEDVKKRTTIYDKDILVTQAVSSNIVSEDISRTIYSADVTDDTGNMSITQAVPTPVKKCKTVFNDGDLSMTQAIRYAKIIPEKSRQTIVDEDDAGNPSTTQAHPNTLIEKAAISDKRRTIVYEDDAANILAVTVTQAISRKSDNMDTEDRFYISCKSEIENVGSELQSGYQEPIVDIKKRTTIYDKNILVTQAVSSNIVSEDISRTIYSADVTDDTGNMSITQAVPTLVKKCKTVFNDGDLSMTQAIRYAKIIPEKSRQTIVDEDDAGNPSTTQAHPNTLIEKAAISDKLRTIVYEDDAANILAVTVTQAIAGKSDNMDTADRFDISCKSEIENVGSELQSGYQVRVYQAALSVKTEKSDFQSANPIILDDEKLTLSTKMYDSEIKQNEKMSTETNSNEVKNTKIQSEAESAIEQQVLHNDDLSMSQVSENTTGVLSKSVLDELLDMSTSNENIDDKHQIVQINEPNDNAKEKLDEGSISSDGSMFYITDDRDGDEAQVKSETDKGTIDLKERTPLQILNKDRDVPPVSVRAQNEKQKIKHAILTSNITHEKISNNDLEKSRCRDSSAFTERKLKTANDTNELLDMLSDLTDKTVRKLDGLEENEDIQEQLALEDKSEFYELEPRRHSFVPRRRSIVMSREDLLRNISLAGEALKSRIDFDDEDLEDDSPEEDKSPEKSVRLSHEVVKTLQFDESATEVSIKLTPLKKTAFGETSYMQEHKKSVIPEFMKDTADGIKELMDDLVKPSAGIPFDSCPAQKPSKKASTCSTQMQANLVTSSQVDLDVNSYSVLNKISLCDITDDAVDKSVSRPHRSPAKTITNASDKSIISDKSIDVPETKQVRIASSCKPMELSSRVLIFDPNNPLNNVILTPEESTETHRYNPGRVEDTVCSVKSNSVQVSVDKDGTERTSVLYSVPELIQSMKQSGDACFKMEVSDSKASTLSKAVSVDQSTEVVNDVKSIEVNTDIAMKGNQEILDTISSLTLVEDAVQSPVDVNLSIEPAINVIHPEDGNESHVEDKRNSKKRLRDKHDHSAVLSLDVTPKPISKMQKFSDSPKHKGVKQSEKETVTQPRRNGKKPTVHKLTENKVDAIHETVDDQRLIETNVNIKSLTDLERSGQNPAQVVGQSTLSKETVTQPRRGGKKPAPAITVPKLTELKVDPTHEATNDVDQIEQSKSSVKPALTDLDSSEMASSFTSSNGLRHAASVTSPPSRKSSQMDRQPIVENADSKGNVKAQIDTMPFMGSRECEWESSSGDTWSFLLLNGRIRLVVRLAGRPDNEGASPDAPVDKVHVESLPPTDTKKTLSIVTVGFATDTMRHFVGEDCARAADVPALVRRCAATARLALRWAKVMNDARLHLAYSLTTQGLLTFKVANIPIRCIWEVSFQLELVLEGRPWIRASDVSVRRVLSCTPPGPARAPPASLMRLPEDWGHAPRTLWAIFKHLKHKTEDEDDALFA